VAKETFVRDDRGRVTHVDQTSDDGKDTWRYTYDGSVLGTLLHGNKGACVEHFEHHEDGTTTSHKK